jgi:glutamate-1-semialdehyde 2,1-aminomutase
MTFRFPTTRSHEVVARLERVMPGGNTRSGVFFRPFPLVLARGSGYRVWDADGNEFIDFLNNFTSLVHGHAHPRIVQAIQEQAPKGTVFSAPTSGQASLAERICRRFPSVKRLRFTNSGSEANIVAVRAARAITGRDHVVMAAAGYHGIWEQVAVQESGEEDANAGIPPAVRNLVRHVPLNDVPALEAVMEHEGRRIACLIFEPVRGHRLLPAQPEFLQAARRLADRAGALLILDEVVTARLDRGGYQLLAGVTPDLTTFGKVIGGGLPVGAVGGKAEILDLFDPRRPDAIHHSGTYNGNELTMAAGCASLDLLPQEEIERINALGDRLRAGLQERFRLAGTELTTGGYGSLVSILPAGDVQSFPETLARFHAAALEEGVYCAARGMLNISTPMDDAIIEEALDRLARVAERVVTREGATS